ncbi:MAG: carboxypeptidase regulatory-like domain-containing protein [Pyrinomonadaceae bacterium]|nr:carboxypeptidase regulatory-like domain-containing protein [Pyrinomonadaceae bacterium]
MRSKQSIFLTIFSFATIFLSFVFFSLDRSPVVSPDAGADDLSQEEIVEQKQKIAENYGKLPLHFEPNLGQTDEQVKFTTRGKGYSLFLTENEAVLALEQKSENKRAVVKMQVEGANDSPESIGLDETAGRSNYFIGNDPDKWQTNVPNYEKVKYSGVYEGIDLVYYGNNQKLEYDFVVAPNADPNQIKLKFNGVKDAKIDEKTGDLLFETEVGEIRQHKPFSYQMIDGEQKEIASLYQVQSAKSKVPSSDENEFIVSFNLANYDRSKELIIDPILVYGSYLGGSEADRGTGITIDSQGNAYIIGSGTSRDFPTTTGVIKPVLLPRTGTTNSFWSDAFVTKINPSGTSIIFSTYLGGTNAGESGGDIEVDAQGNVYVSGTTQSADFPLVNAYRSTVAGPEDAFAAKLNPTGSALIYSTFIGGNNTDTGVKIALNKTTGEATYIGRTYSPDFSTTPGALKERLCNSPTTCSGIFYSGSYVARFASNGDVRFATLFDAGINDVALDANENSVIAGTGSAALTTPGAYQTTSTGGVEGYIGKLNPAGNQIVFGTLLGGGLQSDVVTGIVLDSAQNIYVTGQTENTGFPTTPGAFDTTFNGSGTLEDGFLTKFNPAGSALIYSTFLGGTGKDEPKGIALGSDDSAFIVGETTGASSFPLRNSIMNAGNIFLTHFNPDASNLVYSTLLGQGGGYSIAVDSGDNAYITGKTSNIPVTPGAFQTIRGGGTAVSPDDAYVLKIGPTDETVTHYAISGNVIDENQGFNNNYTPVVATITGTVNRSINLTYFGGPYYFGNLPAGGNYTITVSKAGYEVSPQSEVFNNLGANQFADFTILRNREPQSTITSPAHGTNYDAPATITIQADASDPDAGDTIQKVEFVAYKSGVGNVPIGVDTTAPFEITWNNVPTGTWALYAIPYDNHGLRGQTQNVVHVFVTEPGGPTISLTNPTEGQTFNAGEYITFSVNVSSSVTRVEYYRNDTLFAVTTSSPFTKQYFFTETGDFAITAKASNSQGQTTVSAPVNISVVPFNHTISGRISDSLNTDPVEGITVNLTSPTNPSISGTTTTDANGDYSFTDVFGAGSDAVTVTPVNGNYNFNPANRTFTIGYSDHPNRNFTAIPITEITVAMTSPTNNQQFPANPTITLAADASSTAGAITKVEFYEYVTGQRNLIATDTTAPYSFDWTGVSGGNHWVFARAYDDTGGIADAGSVFFTVAQPPTAIRLQGSVTTPSGGWMQGITVRLTGTVNGQPVNQTSVSNTFGAYGFFNLTAGGDYTIAPEGNGGMTFTPPSVTILNAVADNLDVDFQASAFNQPPTVQINSPSDGAMFTMPAPIPVNVTASDADGTIPHLSVLANGNNRSTTIGQSNNGTLNINWQPTAPGNYIIYATATDSGGLRTTESITITVNPPAPVSISGRIVNRDSVGIEGADLTLENTSDTTVPDIIVQTDANGNYTIPNVATFNHYRLKASKLNYTFLPNYRNYFDIAANQTGGDFTGTLALQPADFDGDGETDLAVWRPADGNWHITRSETGQYSSMQFGGASFGDVAVPGNYDGDDNVDAAVYRNGTWYILNSSDSQVQIRQLGVATDKPIPGDYDGDGKTDIAVWRPSTGVWYIYRSSDGTYDIRQFGLEGDIPIAGDYDSDGKSDLTIWRPSTGVWYIQKSSDAGTSVLQFGANGDVPLTGDFDGDKINDVAVFRPQTGVWYILRSSDSAYTIVQWGMTNDMPVAGDYDRDGKTDIAVFRKSEGNWYILRSSDNSVIVRRFGMDGDVPLPSAFVPR